MKPLILDFKESRKEMASSIIYKYNSELSCNTITIDQKESLFIDLESADIEMLTKTKVHRENDDEQTLLELGTKTEVRRERDDNHNSFVELSTKTYTKSERDD